MDRARAPSRCNDSARCDSRTDTRTGDISSRANSRANSRADSRTGVLADTPCNVKVVVRFRPLNARERAEPTAGALAAQIATDTSCRIKNGNTGHDFTFDRVFNCDSTQEMIFNYSLHQTVEDIVKGFNGTVLAYGQTGAGKSYTMMGPSPQSEDRGAIPRIVDHLFSRLNSELQPADFAVKVSYMEVYNETIKDLLNPKQTNLPLHDISRQVGSGFYVKGLTTVDANSVDDVYKVITQGLSNRAVKSTQLNAESSRSHSILSLKVDQNRSTGDRHGQLYLVDLAGSETAKKTGAEGVVLTEAKNINRSLSALGKVIYALTNPRTTHIPYRDSKLTKILSESLGGNARTTLIVNCSPAAESASETISSLRFGTSAKAIKNVAHVNTEQAAPVISDAAKRELLAWRSGDVVPETAWADIGLPPAGQLTQLAHGPAPWSSSLSFSRRTSSSRLPEDGRNSGMDGSETNTDTERQLVELELRLAESDQRYDDLNQRYDDLQTQSTEQQQEADQRYDNLNQRHNNLQKESAEEIRVLREFATSLRDEIEASVKVDAEAASAMHVHRLQYLIRTLSATNKNIVDKNDHLRRTVLSKRKTAKALQARVEQLRHHLQIAIREGEDVHLKFDGCMSDLKKRIDKLL